MASFFSRSGLELLKERTVQRVQEQLENVGVHSEYIEKRAKRLAGDQELCEFMDLVEQLHESLEGVIKAATVFHKGVCVLQEGGRKLRGAPGDGIRKYACVVREAPTLETTYDENNLRNELQRNVTQPIRLKMRELADIRNRIKETAIVQLEATSRKETVDRLQARQASAMQIGQAEDLYAEKQVEYERMRVRLMDEFALLQRDHERIFQKAFNSFKLCQYRFLMNASATLGAITDENAEGLAASDIGASLQPSPASPADFERPPPSMMDAKTEPVGFRKQSEGDDIDGVADSFVSLDNSYELDNSHPSSKVKTSMSDQDENASKDASSPKSTNFSSASATKDLQKDDKIGEDDDDEEETATL